MLRWIVLTIFFLSSHGLFAQEEEVSDSTDSQKGENVYYFPFNRSEAFPHFTQFGIGYGPMVGTFDLAFQYHFRFFTFRNEFKRGLNGKGWSRLDAAFTGKFFRVRDRFHVSLGVGYYHASRRPLKDPLQFLFSDRNDGLNFYIILERHIGDRFSISLENAFGPRLGKDEKPGPFHMSLKAHIHLFEEPEPPSVERNKKERFE